MCDLIVDWRFMKASNELAETLAKWQNQSTLACHPDHLLRAEDVFDFCGLPRYSSLQHAIKNLGFPAPLKMGKSNVWRLGDIVDYIHSLERQGGAK
jgi:predicted DNA-binding transcriptional regulator AlpA